jgi:plasmid stabilization system protein ParE
VNVHITEEARADLERIGDYIAIDNPVRADTFVWELTNRCLALADMPRAFPLVPRYEHTGVRRRPHGDYLIFYHIGADTVDILHVLNGAQNYEAILFPDE